MDPKNNSGPPTARAKKSWRIYLSNVTNFQLRLQFLQWLTSLGHLHFEMAGIIWHGGMLRLETYKPRTPEHLKWLLTGNYN